MTPEGSPYYRLAPGVEDVPLPGGGLLLRSDYVNVRLEGDSAQLFRERVLPLLDGRADLAEVARRLGDVDPEDLRAHLDQLFEAGALLRSPSPLAALDAREGQLLSIAVDPAAAAERLAAARVGLFGLDAVGARLALALADAGVGELVLFDPFPLAADERRNLPAALRDAPGATRAEAVAAGLARMGTGTSARVVGDAHELTRERVTELAADAHLLVSTFDRGFSSAHHWVNRAGLEHRTPCLFAELEAHRALCGPLVLPGQTACYMCYRMRAIACAPDYPEAMAYERHLDGLKRPSPERPALAGLADHAAGMLALEVYKHVLELGRQELGETLLELDGLTLETTRHPVLRRADCPSCGASREPAARPHPTLEELLEDEAPPGRLEQLEHRLVSPRTGVVTRLVPISKGPDEPHEPYVVSGFLSNNRFFHPYQSPVCGGKGTTFEAARVSCLGEAVERYSASYVDAEPPVYARRAELSGRSVDPRELALFLPEQYAELPFVPYTDDSVLGWVRCRSLTRGDMAWVPATATTLYYAPRFPSEAIRSFSSNGLATGPTLASAVLRGTLELLERDAFMITWLNRLPTRRVSAADHPSAAARRLAAGYERRGVRVHLFELPTDHLAYAYAALGVQLGSPDSPTAMFGLGCSLSRARAAEQSLMELAQIRPGFRVRMNMPDLRKRIEELQEDVTRVETLEDHTFVYTDDRQLHRLAFLLERPLEDAGWDDGELPDERAQLAQVTEHFRARGDDLLYANLTPDDMGALGLHTVHALLPGYQPIHFGYKERPLANPRLYELGHRLGLQDAPATPATLNPDPHPIA